LLRPKSNEAVLIDFGLAREFNPHSAPTTVTPQGNGCS
jgi:hypothetical protein